jgi:hypothetical protein
MRILKFIRWLTIGLGALLGSVVVYYSVRFVRRAYYSSFLVGAWRGLAGAAGKGICSRVVLLPSTLVGSRPC